MAGRAPAIAGSDDRHVDGGAEQRDDHERPDREEDESPTTARRSLHAYDRLRLARIDLGGDPNRLDVHRAVIGKLGERARRHVHVRLLRQRVALLVRLSWVEMGFHETRAMEMPVIHAARQAGRRSRSLSCVLISALSAGAYLTR
jgi:hypothetical protein